jgi:hypothetical protein
MKKAGSGRRVVRPESEDRGSQAAELRRRRAGADGRTPAGDEGIAPNQDAHPVEETTSNTRRRR